MPYMTKVNIAMLDRVTSPVFRPKPTVRRESKAPRVEIIRSCLLPIRFYKSSAVRLSETSKFTSIRIIGGKVMRTFTMVILNET